MSSAHRKPGVGASTDCRTAPPFDAPERRRIEKNRLLSSRDLGPVGQQVSGNELLLKNNDVWFGRTVDACSGEGLQTVNGSATVQRARIGHAAPFAFAPQVQGGPACVPTKLSTSSPRRLTARALSEPLAAMSAAATSAGHDARAAPGAQPRHAGRKSRLMFAPLCSQRQRFGFNGQRNRFAEALKGHVQARRLARPLAQWSRDARGTLDARQRLGAPCRSRARSAARSRTVLGPAHANSPSPRRVDEGAVSNAWPARVCPTTPTHFSVALR